MIAPVTSNEILQNISQTMSVKRPDYLLKFYSSKPYNFDAVENGKIFLSSPSRFNDPYDCKLTYNKEDVIKRYVVDWMLRICKDLDNNTIKQDSFDRNDILKVCHTKDTSPICHKGGYTYTFVEMLNSILSEKNYQFRKYVDNQINSLLKGIDKFMCQIEKAANIGVSCFCNYSDSKNLDQMNLMWAHYAMNHTGFCVMYKFDKDGRGKLVGQDGLKYLLPVRYTKHRTFVPKMILFRYLQGRMTEQDYQNIIHKKSLSILTKSTVWNYENEWRLISDKVDETISFPYAAAIFVGCRTQKKHKERLTIIANKLGIPLYQTELDNKIYKLNNFDPDFVDWIISHKNDHFISLY